MNKEQFIRLISQKIRLIRTEAGHTQEAMAEILGISKKTLVQIEKDRILAGWSTAVVVCALFRESEILHYSLGGDPLEMLDVYVHDGLHKPKPKTLGGKVWWKEVEKNGVYRLQQNMISQHYRILDCENQRWLSSNDLEEARMYFEQLTKE
ncbi:helix-turn-helix transcriptional regulator [Bacillus suaedaesalsae]|uniref:Helix-turn-helix domain-containing protein n=1 Tax=Bacillus suaedaesalsae TaxID=2810349 RepID=A0ABS2DN91_9BACI|nr:helix-turn-helix domain-containing protein [Bacillus suaedaesalsae]MBM6619500.1 helix-turn-helix domain-containing protein [Bacillus suaedaesalsae]